jgi:hypothetical protein
MPDFRGVNTFIVQPNDVNVPLGFKFEPASTAILNDGSIPFQTSVVSAVVTAEKDDGTDVTDTMISPTPIVLDDTVNVRINWPGAAGRYHMKFVLTLDDGADKEFDFNRFVGRDK